MIGSSILNQLFTNILETKFVTEVYHSVMLKPLDQGGFKPMAPVAKRWVPVGIDDTKGFTCYCRQTGSADVSQVENLGSCNLKKYRFQIAHKLVFYHEAEERNHDQIIAMLSSAVMKTNLLNVQKITTIPEDILRSEAPTSKFKLKDNTFYVSIDFFILLDLQANTCEQEIQCEAITNPVCITA